MSEADDLDIRELEEFTAIVPYLKTLNTVFQYVKRKRIERFFLSLASLTREFSDTDKRRLNEYVESEIGSEVLTDFFDISQRTSSKIANTTLAIIYAKASTGAYDHSFALRAGKSLDGLDDYFADILIYFFSPVAMRYCKLEDESLYRLYSLYPSHLKGGGSVVTRLDGVVQDFEHLVMVINEFTSRGILMPDPSPGRFSGDEIKTPVFGAGEYSEQLRLLMLEAKELLHM